MDYGQVEKLDDLNHGIVGDLFPDAFREVLDNIADENTPETATREIVITLKFKPTKKRDAIDSSIDVKTKLASPKVSESRLLLSSDGRKTTAHYLKDEPTQPELGDVVPFKKAEGESE